MWPGLSKSAAWHAGHITDMTENNEKCMELVILSTMVAEGHFPKLRKLDLSCSVKFSHPVKFLITKAKMLKELKVSLSDYETGDNRQRFVDAANRCLDFILDNVPDNLDRLEISEPKLLTYQYFKLLRLKGRVNILKLRGCPINF